MINIALYVNGKENALIARNLIRTHLKNSNQLFKLITYDSCKGMKLCMEQNDTDIYIIDFSDVEKASLLVETLRRVNSVSAVIIANTSVEVLKKYLYIRPSAYVENLSNEKELRESIECVKNDINLKDRYFVFKYSGEVMRIPYDKISYFESNARKVTLTEFDKPSNYSFMAKLDDIQSRLPDCFLRCHQSYLVNMRHILRLDKNTHSFILFNSQEVFISRRLYSEVVKKYEMYVLKRRNGADFNTKLT